MLEKEDDPAQIVVIEVWEDIESHQASIKNIPPEALEKAMQFLADSPQGAYYNSF